MRAIQYSQSSRFSRYGGGYWTPRCRGHDTGTMVKAMNSLDGEITDGKHRQQVRVYYEDTDFSGIVYHAS